MTAEDVDYGVLGPLVASAGGNPVRLGGRVQRAMLGALLLHANEPVSSDRLVEWVWGESPPASAAHAVSVYVSKLRKELGEDAIVRAPAGYVLRVAPGRLDLDRFESLAREARELLALGDAARSCELLDDALALWRGAALGGLELESFAQASIARLEELRLAAVATRAEARLALGRAREVVPELEAVVQAHPYDERLCGLLMLALYRSGRQADALAAFQSLRARLAGELGLEPSDVLRELERRILARDPTLELEPEEQAIRSVVVLPARLDQLEELAVLSEPFGLSRNPHEVILTWIERPGPAGSISAALAEAHRLLAALRSRLVERGARARIAAFTADDPVADILRLARRPEVDLLLLAEDLEGLDDGTLAPSLAAVLNAAPCDVAVWFRRTTAGDAREGPIVVPFGALEHDWAALELAAWLAATTQRRLVLVGHSGAEGELRDASRLLADAGLLLQRASGVVPEPRLAAPGRTGLADAVTDAGLVVAGLSERWASEGLGATRLELARAAPAPVLFLRRGHRPGGLSPPESATLYRWSVTAAV